MYRQIKVNLELLDKLYDDIDCILVCNSSELLLDEQEKNSLYRLKEFINDKLSNRLTRNKVKNRLLVNLS